MSQETFSHEGTVIHATHRPEDLIPAFSQKLKELDTDNKHASLIKDCDRMAKILSVLDRNRQSPNDNTREMASDLVEELFDALDSLSPPGYYFGATEGDGSDFGFWKNPEEDDADAPV